MKKLKEALKREIKKNSFRYEDSGATKDPTVFLKDVFKTIDKILVQEILNDSFLIFVWGFYLDC